jgi:hypothetical protein
MSKGTVEHTVAAGRPLLKLLRLCWAARRPVLLRGGTGVGKSELLQQFADELGVGYVCRDLSLMEPPDLVGMPQLRNGRTHFLPPAFLPDGKDEGEGLFVLEEINRAPEYMRAPCLQLLTDRGLNDYKLPEGWLPVAAINPAEDGYDAAELDPALLSRFVQVSVVPDRDEWLAWAKEHGVHKDVIGYVGTDPNAFGSVQSNPRAWHYVSDLLHADRKCKLAKTDLALFRAAVAGCVSTERAVAFVRYLKGGCEPLTAGEILEAYGSHRKALRGWAKAGRTDLIEATVLNVQKHLQAETDYEAVRDDRAAWKNLGCFLADLPGDLRKEATRFFAENGYDSPPLANAKPGRKTP